jgi:hypothetical protein
MNTAERLRAMEALSDALLHEDGDPQSPAGMAIFWREESGE